VPLQLASRKKARDGGAFSGLVVSITQLTAYLCLWHEVLDLQGLVRERRLPQTRSMTITYSNGTVLEAIVLSHEEEAVRVAVAGDGDVRTFRRIHGVWLSEECKAVAVEFAWGRHGANNVPDGVDCICHKKLASRLISMLLAGTDEDDLLEDALYVLSAEGNRVRINQSMLEVN
jgi:hypothetical protein